MLFITATPSTASTAGPAFQPGPSAVDQHHNAFEGLPVAHGGHIICLVCCSSFYLVSVFNDGHFSLFFNDAIDCQPTIWVYIRSSRLRAFNQPTASTCSALISTRCCFHLLFLSQLFKVILLILVSVDNAMYNWQLPTVAVSGASNTMDAGQLLQFEPLVSKIVNSEFNKDTFLDHIRKHHGVTWNIFSITFFFRR